MRSLFPPQPPSSTMLFSSLLPVLATVAHAVTALPTALQTRAVTPSFILTGDSTVWATTAKSQAGMCECWADGLCFTCSLAR